MMETMSGHIPCQPFTRVEMDRLRSRFDPSDVRRTCIYDIRLANGQRAGEPAEAMRKGVVKLSSRNLGFDFMLLNVGVGKGLFGLPRTVVEIYARKLGGNHYWLLCTSSNLARALRTIDRIYNEAADGYLP